MHVDRQFTRGAYGAYALLIFMSWIKDSRAFRHCQCKLRDSRYFLSHWQYF